MGTKNFNTTCYTYDVILVANEEDKLQTLGHRFNVTMEQYNMQISTQKL